ncbi:MAG: response regulator transcription factor [Candidatus Promineifilaceae bacterium]|nr:response regulator transcription factor [Candidatus Promineifilaceae bacterium]
MQTILIVDDEKAIRDMVEEYLTGEGFRVVEACHGREALHIARHEKPDIILLDVMMPKINGYDFLRIFGQEADTPIIMLTAKIEENDKVLGLELGADDYMTKPFSMRELTARVRAMLRRMQKAANSGEVLRVADIVLDNAMRRVTVGEQAIELTPSEFHILHTFMRFPGRVFSRLELIDEYDADFDGFERSVDAHIRRLRGKIEPDRKNPRYIETVYGFGYRLVRPDIVKPSCAPKAQN